MTTKRVRRLDQDWERIGELGVDHALVVGPAEVTVVMLKDGKKVKKPKRYVLDEVYARLIHDAYKRGRDNKNLW